MYLLCANESFAAEPSFSQGPIRAYTMLTPIAFFSTEKKMHKFINKLDEYGDNAGEQGYSVCTNFEELDLRRTPTDPATITRAMKKRLRKDD